MASAGSIFVDLLLKDAAYTSGWQRARNTTKQGSAQIQGDMGKIGQSVTAVINPVNNLSNAIRNVTGVLAGAFSVQRITQYSDQWRQLEGRLNIVAGEFGNVAKTQQDLFDIAQRTRQPLDGIMSFYSRLAQFIPEAERAQYDLLGVTESVSTALAITGETSASATGAMIQFTQAIGTNFEAAGQELRSLQEQAPRLTQALMRALGDGTKSLQQLKEEGLLTRQSVLNALSGMGEEGKRLREELEKVPLTVGQAFQRLDNAFLKFIGQSKEVNNVTGALALGISNLSKNLELVAQSITVIAIASSAIFLAKFLNPIIKGMQTYVASTRAISIANAQVASSSLAYSVEATRAAGATQYYAAAAGRSAIVSSALAKQQLAAAGSYSATTIAVNSLGAAMVRNNAIMGAAATIGRGLLAIVGGPLGAAFLAAGAAVYYLTTRLTEQEKVARDLDQSSYKIQDLYAKLSGASQKRTAEIRKEIVAEYDLQVARLASSRSDLEQIRSGRAGLIGRASEYITPAERNLAQRISAQEKALREFEKLALESESRNSILSNVIGPSPATDEKATKSIEKWLIKQREALETMKQESQYIGMTSIEIEKLKDAREFEAQIAERSYGLKGKELERFREQAEAIKKLRQEVIQYNYEASRSAEAGFKQFSAEYIENATNAAQNIKDVLTKAFKGAEDAFIEFTKTGKLNFRDLANSIIEDLLRIQFRKTMAGILGGLDSILDSGSGSAQQSGGSGIGAFLGKTFAGLFADGGYIPPGQWGIAGEAGAEAIYGGKSGVTVVPNQQGNVYNIDARGADQGAVLRIEQSLMALAGPGVIEYRVSNAQIRGGL